MRDSRSGVSAVVTIVLVFLIAAMSVFEIQHLNVRLETIRTLEDQNVAVSKLSSEIALNYLLLADSLATEIRESSVHTNEWKLKNGKTGKALSYRVNLEQRKLRVVKSLR